MTSRLKTIALITAFTFISYADTQAQRPNIIYIMTDDMGYADLSGYGRKDYQTPNLDKLASQGIKFTHAYSAGPLCTPTRVGFMTGRYPARTDVGLREPLIEKDTFGLTAADPSVATSMKQSGYETVLIGKWHLGFEPKHHPLRNGYDYFFGILSGAADYISHKSDGALDLFENNNPVNEKGYLTDMFTTKAVSFLKQQHTKPFFLTLNYNAPHWPWQGPADKAYPDTMGFRKGGSPAIYAAMMKSLDDGIGAVMKALDDAGLSKNTIVIFTNDNGGERYSDHGGLAESKGTLWEGGIRVPAFVRWPGKIIAGSVTQQPAITMDWTATILAAGVAKIKNGFSIDGIDLMPLCRGKKGITERTFYWRTFQRTRHKAIRDGKWKYLKVNEQEYLFDLIADPGEKNNLKAIHEAIFTRLKAKYAMWEKDVLVPVAL